MSLEGMKISKKFKLRTDLFHHTHEVWGLCSYKNTPFPKSSSARVGVNYKIGPDF